MKQANVVEVRDITASRPEVKLGDPAKRDRIEQLLRKYPDTSEDEVAEIRHFLATGNHLDVGLVAGSDQLKEKVQRFRKEHRQHFRLKFREAMMFLFVTLGPISALFWRYLH